MQLTPETILAVWNCVPWDEPVGSFMERVGGAFDNREGSLWWTSANRKFYSRPSDHVACDAIRYQRLCGKGVELDADLSGASEPEWWSDPETRVRRAVLYHLHGIDQFDWGTPTAPFDKDWPANRFLDDHRLLSDGKDKVKALVTFEEAAASRRGFGTAPARGVFDDAIDLSVAEVDEGQLESHDADEGLSADLTIGGDPREHQACPVCDGNVEWGECDNECHYKAKPNLNHLSNFLFAKGKVTPKPANPRVRTTRAA